MIASDAIAAQVAELLDDVLPSEANAAVVTAAGGAANAYGEVVGATESLADIFLFITGEDRAARLTAAGDTQPIALRFVAKASVAIDEGDRIRCSGKDYHVEAVTVMAVGDDDIYVEGRLRRIHGN